jgi:MerR family transcriptional regulator/heat shock protein HspR
MAEKKIKRGKAFFSISAVSKMFSVHQQTIRLYEKEGFINPKRSDGNTRMFSEEDIERLEEVIYLTHQLGINLAGVEMILQLQKKMKKMQQDMNKIFTETQKELVHETQSRKDLISNYTKQLKNKKEEASHVRQEKSASQKEKSMFKDWDVDYEE